MQGIITRKDLTHLQDRAKKLMEQVSFFAVASALFSSLIIGRWTTQHWTMQPLKRARPSGMLTSSAVFVLERKEIILMTRVYCPRSLRGWESVRTMQCFCKNIGRYESQRLVYFLSSFFLGHGLVSKQPVRVLLLYLNTYPVRKWNLRGTAWHYMHSRNSMPHF